MDHDSGGYEFIEYRPELRDQVLQLQTFMWSPDVSINAAYFDWKYTHNPYVDNPAIYLAMHAGQVVGMRTMFEMRWEGGAAGKVFHCLQDADGVVHPEHRRRGLYERIMVFMVERLQRRNFGYAVTLGGQPFSIAAHLKLGWQSVGELAPMQRPATRGEESSVRKFVRQLPVLPSIYRRLRRVVSDGVAAGPYVPYATFDLRSMSCRTGPFSRIQVEKTPRPAAMAALVKRLGHDGRLRHVRDQEFFAWRFQNPLSEYRFLFWGEAELEGYLVLQMASQPGEAPWCTIVDWEAAADPAREDLLQAAIEWGNFENLVVWSAALPDPMKSLLDEWGFHLIPVAEAGAGHDFGPRFLLRVIRPDIVQLNWPFTGPRLLDLANWDMRAIYSDIF